MANGVRKVFNCPGCNVGYNIANLKPGTKFKCQKCGMINTVPVAPPAVQPAQMQKPVQAASPSQMRPPAPPQRPQTKPPSPLPPKAAAPPPKPKEAFVEEEIPQNEAPAEEEVTEEEAPPTRRPTSRLGKSGLAAQKGGSVSKFGKLGKLKGGKGASKFGKKLPSRKGAEEGEGEEGFEEEPKKKNKMLLIGGIVGGVIVLIVIIILLSGSKETDKKDKKNGDEETTEEQPKDEAKKTNEPAKPKLKGVENWVKADEALKTEISEMIKTMRDKTKTSGDIAKMYKDVVAKGDIGIVALIDLLVDAPEGPDAKLYFSALETLTKKQFAPTGPGRRKPLTPAEILGQWKMFWLNKDTVPDYVYPSPALIKGFDDSIASGATTASGTGDASSGGGGSLKIVGDFKPLVKEDLQPKVISILRKTTEREIEFDDALKQLTDIGKNDVVPVLIIELANDDIFIGQEASRALIKITGWSDAPNLNAMNEAGKYDICVDWQRWWLANKDK
ncbi:MAG: hypothetical protein HY811_04675 [Planctomycetes bacterium]|nr:hypothetical protein [Planctomycetota bacterium]